MFSVTDENLTPREYVLIINATDVLGQSASLNVPFTLTGIMRCVTVLNKKLAYRTLAIW